MKRWLVLLTALLAGSLMWASDPWKEKKYTEWSDKEIDKVLKDSPWARTVPIALPGGPQTGGDTGRRRRGAGGGAGGGMGGGMGGTGVSGDPEAEPGGGGVGGRGPADELAPAPRRELRVLVRWQTALPVRQALARQQIKAEKLTPEQAEQFLSRPTDRYVLVLAGVPAGALAGATPENVKAATFLQAGAGKRIPVEDLRMSQGPAPELFFIFPRATPPLGLDSKSVEFATKLGRLEIKKKFAMKDLVVDGKPEL